jgi:hypothetical protein
MNKSFTLALVLTLTLFASSVFAGDCTKTVMGGGCTAEVEQGTSIHMRGSAAKATNQEIVKVSAPKNDKINLASNQKAK